MADFSLFPEDVLINILLRLPIKYVFRYRSVCKNWNSLLRSPHFSSLFKDHQLCRQERLAKEGVSSFIVIEYIPKNSLREECCPKVNYKLDIGLPCVISHYEASYDTHSENYRIQFDGKYNSYDHAYLLLSFVTLKKMNNELITVVDKVEKHDILYPSLDDGMDNIDITFSNVYNGIICLGNDTGVILYNPYTRESQRLLFRPCVHPEFYYHVILGLWFESNQPTTIKPYKVISVLALEISELHYTCVIEKYDSTESNWSEVMTMHNQLYGFHPENCLLFNEILHMYNDDCSDSLITLNIRSETPGLLPLPLEIREIKHRYGSNHLIPKDYIFVLGGSLSLVAPNESVSCIDIWMMTEYGVKESWTKQYTISEEYITSCHDFNTHLYGTQSNVVGHHYPFKLGWMLLLNWKCMDEDKLILEILFTHSDKSFYDVIVSFDLLSNKLTEIDLFITGKLLSVVPCCETILSQVIYMSRERGMNS